MVKNEDKAWFVIVAKEDRAGSAAVAKEEDKARFVIAEKEERKHGTRERESC